MPSHLHWDGGMEARGMMAGMVSQPSVPVPARCRSAHMRKYSVLRPHRASKEAVINNLVNYVVLGSMT